jgi:nucleoside 2-deoxyribosyltransferase
MIYLAAPFTHPAQIVQADRVRSATAMAARLAFAGHPVYSPITHGYALQDYLPELPHEWWMEQCLPFVARAQAVLVLQLQGWDESKGVAIEVLAARMRGVPVAGLTFGVANLHSIIDLPPLPDRWPALDAAELPISWHAARPPLDFNILEG